MPMEAFALRPIAYKKLVEQNLRHERNDFRFEDPIAVPELDIIEDTQSDMSLPDSSVLHKTTKKLTRKKLIVSGILMFIMPIVFYAVIALMYHSREVVPQGSIRDYVLSAPIAGIEYIWKIPNSPKDADIDISSPKILNHSNITDYLKLVPEFTDANKWIQDSTELHQDIVDAIPSLGHFVATTYNPDQILTWDEKALLGGALKVLSFAAIKGDKQALLALKRLRPILESIVVDMYDKWDFYGCRKWSLMALASIACDGDNKAKAFLRENLRRIIKMPEILSKDFNEHVYYQNARDTMKREQSDCQYSLKIIYKSASKGNTDAVKMIEVFIDFLREAIAMGENDNERGKKIKYHYETFYEKFIPFAYDLMIVAAQNGSEKCIKILEGWMLTEKVLPYGKRTKSLAVLAFCENATAIQTLAKDIYDCFNAIRKIDDNPSSYTYDINRTHYSKHVIVEIDGRKAYMQASVYYELVEYEQVIKGSIIALARSALNDSEKSLKVLYNIFKTYNSNDHDFIFMHHPILYLSNEFCKNGKWPPMLRDMVYKYVIQFLAQNGYIPQLDNKLYLNILYSISNPTRFYLDDLGKVIKNRMYNKPDSRPLAVAVYATSDHNGFLSQEDVFRSLNKEFRLMYYEASKDEDVYKSIEDATEKQKADVIILAAHSSQASMSFGSKDPRLEKLSPADEVYTLDLSDENEMKLRNLGLRLKKGGDVFVLGCNAAEGREKGDNIINLLRKIFPDAGRIVGYENPVSITSGDGLKYGAYGRISEVPTKHSRDKTYVSLAGKTPEEVLERFHELKEKNGEISLELIEMLLNTPYSYREIIEELTDYGFFSEEAVKKLIKALEENKSHSSFMEKIAKNLQSPNISEDLWMLFVKNKDRSIRSALASNANPRIPKNIWMRLLKDPDSTVRGALAENSNISIPKDILQRIMKDTSTHVRQSLLSNPNVDMTPEFIEKVVLDRLSELSFEEDSQLFRLWRKVRGNDKASPRALLAFILQGNFQVSLEALNHPNAPLAAFVKMIDSSYVRDEVYVLIENKFGSLGEHIVNSYKAWLEISPNQTLKQGTIDKLFDAENIFKEAMSILSENTRNQILREVQVTGDIGKDMDKLIEVITSKIEDQKSRKKEKIVFSRVDDPLAHDLNVLKNRFDEEAAVAAFSTIEFPTSGPINMRAASAGYDSAA